jgi:hypothetical protein
MDQLVRRHEILRTIFLQRDGKIVQRVLPAADCPIQLFAPEGPVSSAAMRAITGKEYLRRFDPGIFPLFHLQLFNLAECEYNLLVTMHHIITDGYSWGIIARELMELYAGITANKPPALPQLPYQYRHFSEWQKHFLLSAEGIRHKEYWLRKLEGFSHTVNLSGAGKPDRAGKGPIIVAGRSWEGPFYDKMSRFIKDSRITRTVLFMGALLIACNRLGSQEDIALFVTVSGRNSKYYGRMDLSGLIGFFSNMLLVRNKVSRDRSVADFLREVQQGFLDDLNYEAYPIGKLIGELPVPQTPDFLHGTVFLNYHLYDHTKGSVVTGRREGSGEKKLGEMSSGAAFGLEVTEYKNCLKGRLLFNERYFTREGRSFTSDLLSSILTRMIETPQISVGEI